MSVRAHLVDILVRQDCRFVPEVYRVSMLAWMETRTVRVWTRGQTPNVIVLLVATRLVIVKRHVIRPPPVGTRVLPATQMVRVWILRHTLYVTVHLVAGP